MCKLFTTMRRQKHQKTFVPKVAQRVSGLTNRVYVHAALRQMRCVLCGNLHEQQYLAAGLFEGDRHLGDLCPRCLHDGPRESANRLRQRLAQTSTAVNDSAASAAQAPPASAELPALADALALLDKWPTLLEEVMEQERAVLRQRFSGLREDDIRKLVDDRYREYLE